MLALHTHATLSSAPPGRLFKVLGIGEALDAAISPRQILVDQRGARSRVDAEALRRLGMGGIIADDACYSGSRKLFVLSGLSEREVVAPGDVVRVREPGRVSVLYRRGANANFLLATERCNSLCLMCSQPPRDDDDDWRIDEMLDVIPLIDRNITRLGITGGEPTLHGARLAEVMRDVLEHLPQAQLNILSNARRFADPALADSLSVGGQRVLWAVPLYADTAARHDYIVQARSAFEETLHGLYNLAERGAAIELRLVIHAQTVDRLLQFSEFVWRTLPFVKHVAFMGLEPMGFAKQNRDLLFLDPLDYAAALEEAAWYLHDRGIATSIYNTPLCVLAPSAWPLAKRSISDWKNVYAPECEACSVRERCGGFFKSAGAQWRSRGIHPIHEEATS